MTTRASAADGPGGAPAPHRPCPPFLFALLALLGVVLPLCALGFELATGVCAELFFDPLPSGFHAVLVALVPLGNVLGLRALRRGARRRTAAVRWAGAALGVALFYALVFLPLTPLAAMGVLFAGLGLLPLAPLLATIGGFVLVRRLHRLEPERARRRHVLEGAALAALALVAVNLPATLTHVGVLLARSEDAVQRARGLVFLRRAGSEDELLRACYGRSRFSADPLSALLSARAAVTPRQAQALYYRVTGRPFNAAPPPAGLADRWLLDPDLRWLEDEGLGGDEVAARVGGLSLDSSFLDAQLAPEALCAYFEWTLHFKNAGLEQREARAELSLPSGGVVSRLTLWINGEEREAAFAGRGDVRAAYTAVVQRRRDPVLVTTSGPDRVLLQCFPVPAGGRMKVRVGISAPLIEDGPGEGVLRLPALDERNFALADASPHELWLASSAPFVPTLDQLALAQPDDGAHVARGRLADRVLGDPATLVRVVRPPGARAVLAPDLLEPERHAVRQTLVDRPAERPGRVVIVVEDTASSAGSGAALADALGDFPRGVELAVLVAGDGPPAATAPLAATPARLAALGAELRTLAHEGGSDAVPPLVAALDLAAGRADGVVLWLEGAQPAVFAPSDGLERRLVDAQRARLLALRTAPGPNAVARALGYRRGFRELPRRGALRDDLRRLFASWSGARADRTLVRERVASSAAVPTAPAHVARLWAFEESLELARSGARARAIELAAAHQLVTPTTGAVVLETREQYERAGLEPVDPATVPSVPEPGAMALVALALAALALAWRRRRSGACAG